MPQYSHMDIRYPPGANDNSDPTLMAETRAAQMIGLAQVAPGVGTQAFAKKIVQLDSSFAPTGKTIEGMTDAARYQLGQSLGIVAP